jgi:ribosomal protein S18 acetylase RimI-like enzyme
MSVTIRPLAPQDMDWARNAWRVFWGSETIVSRGERHELPELPGFIALVDDEPSGVASYMQDGRGGCELVSLHSSIEGSGAGTRLVEAVVEAARAQGCKRVWLITTNDNTDALRWYQKRGFRLSALYVDAVTQARAIKPEIPATGDDGIPIRDEIEMELVL